MTTAPKVEVTGADREAATDFRKSAIERLIAGDPGGWKDTPDDYLVQAFARHRIASAADNLALMREAERVLNLARGSLQPKTYDEDAEVAAEIDATLAKLTDALARPAQ